MFKASAMINAPAHGPARSAITKPIKDQAKEATKGLHPVVFLSHTLANRTTNLRGLHLLLKALILVSAHPATQLIVRLLRPANFSALQTTMTPTRMCSLQIPQTFLALHNN
ncbi:hypothetical protein K443DRAFT_15527 [Laccaria amethystina LaAM-08-1]|uniref:Unplaced genomic scaffold K443scaffold_753, whole genome shotgun sequence n=1 Tax=Laccaria amethystina LaAM-08-1 TaxID=1095629 RepID=A0A0C9WXJ2_9AGAR|nr:hypothetical protein K443DRAFT_15527 [Laccaria amethystina LaAM-08-1]